MTWGPRLPTVVAEGRARFADVLLVPTVAIGLVAPSPGVVSLPMETAVAEPLFLVRDDDLREASGISVSRSQRLVWTHNDAGNPPIVYGVAPTGEVRVRVHVGAATAEDWEDVAVARVSGRHYVYVSDVGDAYQARKQRDEPNRREFEVIRFPEPIVTPAEPDVRTTAEVFPIRFEGDEPVNVEAMTVLDSGRVLLIEKVETADRPARVWSIERPLVGRLNSPVAVAEVPLIGVSGADVSADGSRLVLRDAQAAYVYELTADLGATFAVAPEVHPLPRDQQGEGIAYTLTGDGLVVIGEGKVPTTVWFVPLAAGTRPAFAPLPPPPARGPQERAADTDPVHRLPVVAVALAVAAIAARRGVRRERPRRRRHEGPRAGASLQLPEGTVDRRGS